MIQQATLEAARAELKNTGKNDSNNSLLDAISFCRQWVIDKAAKIADAKTAGQYFNDLIKYMRDSVTVVRLTVPNESNAFRVFETLNDRGMDLSAVDLLKNYLFGCVHDDAKPQGLQQMEHRWSQLTGTLQNLRQEDFLKVYWTSRHGLVLLDDIFERVKATCRTAQEAQDLSIDLLEAAEHYAALDEPDDAVWSPFGPDTKKLIGNLRVLGSKLVRPVILSGLKRLDPRDFERLLKVLEVIVVRWQLIGEGRTGTIERVCARLASQIWDGKIKNKTGFVEVLSELYTSDDDFRDSFIAQDNLANQKAAYLLRRIEEHERSIQRGSAGKELVPGELTLEHVLPKNPSQEWANVIRTDPTIVEECVGRIGNMCLLAETRNREAGRQGFSKKRPVFQASELLTTQRIALAPDWDRKAIEHHQIWLASKAVAIWRLD